MECMWLALAEEDHISVNEQVLDSHGVSTHVSCVETVSRHGFSCLCLDSVSTLVCLVLALSRVSMSLHV